MLARTETVHGRSVSRRLRLPSIFIWLQRKPVAARGPLKLRTATSPCAAPRCPAAGWPAGWASCSAMASALPLVAFTYTSTPLPTLCLLLFASLSPSLTLALSPLTQLFIAACVTPLCAVAPSSPVAASPRLFPPRPPLLGPRSLDPQTLHVAHLARLTSLPPAHHPLPSLSCLAKRRPGPRSTPPATRRCPSCPPSTPTPKSLRLSRPRSTPPSTLRTSSPPALRAIPRPSLTAP
jgi:hypothetical protein